MRYFSLPILHLLHLDIRRVSQVQCTS